MLDLSRAGAKGEEPRFDFGVGLAERLLFATVRRLWGGGGRWDMGRMLSRKRRVVGFTLIRTKGLGPIAHVSEDVDHPAGIANGVGQPELRRPCAGRGPGEDGHVGPAHKCRGWSWGHSRPVWPVWKRQSRNGIDPAGLLTWEAHLQCSLVGAMESALGARARSPHDYVHHARALGKRDPDLESGEDDDWVEDG